MKKSLILVAGVTGCLLVLLAVLWLLPAPNFPRDAPRDLPWELPDYRRAASHHEMLDDGRIRIEIEHLPLAGVSPQMLAFFYRVLPISTVELSGKQFPLYHIFHPSEHGQIALIEKASDGSEGMGVGAIVGRREWFGPYPSQGQARVLSFTDGGMVVQPEVAGLAIGQITHSYEQTDNGARYRVSTVLGSELPLLGPLVNLYLRHKVFTPPMIEQWIRHQVEEVGSLPYFLPQLYHSQTGDYRFVLDERTSPAKQHL